MWASFKGGTARLYLHESGSLDRPKRGHQPLIGFLFLNFDLEFLIRIRSSESLYSKIPPISCFFDTLFVYLEAVISSISKFIKTAELLFLDWDIGLLSSSRVPNFADRKLF